MTTESLPGSVTMPRERSHVRGFRVHCAAPTMPPKNLGPGEVSVVNGRIFHIRSNEGRTSRARTTPPVE